MNLNDMNVDEICKELDSMSLRMLQLMKEYIHVKVTIESLIKNGCLHLAKSRYIMGNRNVSALQLPTEDGNEITAATTVICKESTHSEEDALILELNRLNINDNGKGSGNEVIRQRVKNEENETTNTAQTPMQDPLKWFGVLIPQDMRQAQSNFNSAIEYVIQCANIQLEMISIEDKYKKYLNKKNKMSKHQ